MANFNLKLKFEKCQFHATEVDFLGYLVNTEGIKVDPIKVKAIQEWPIPTNVREVQSFLGMVNFNRKFIKDFSKIAIPLSALTKKDQPFDWTKEC